MKALIALLVSIILPATVSAQNSAQLNLMPMPAQIQMGSAELVIDTNFSISGVSDPRLQRAAVRFLDTLRRQTGMTALDMKMAGGEKATLSIHADRPSKPIPELGEDESYKLEVTSSGANLTAPTTLGILRGLQTFLQLVEIHPQGFIVPAISIQDFPRFPWRGLMIDCGRHFFPLDQLKRELDGMETVKLNVFHWHLSDNQGFRAESKKFPKLQEMGSDGLFYTQDQIRDLIAYAADRGIRVVPEFDMPGHSTAWFVGYPELASMPGPYQIERKWGVFDPAMDPAEESTYKFLDEFIGEMAKLFPDAYFHIGGDEVNGKQWNANPKIQAFMRAHGIKNNAELQAHFNTKVQKIVAKQGKIMEGWDEILAPDLPKNIVIQSWRGQGSLADAAKQGYSGLLSYGYYLDLNWHADQHYAVDPMADAAANLSSEEKKRILGGEACMWSEYVSPENVDSRIWPRLAAIAERLWSPQSVTDVNSMYARMGAESLRLEWVGLTHRSYYAPMLQRLAGSDDIAAVRTLADVVEPVKDYKREELATVEATSLTPLNRMIDAAQPESEVARKFSQLVDTYIAGNASEEDKAEIRRWLMLWRDNDADLQAQAAKSLLLQEVAPISRNLAGSSRAALLVMRGGDLDFNTGASQAEPPTAQLLLSVAPAIEKLAYAANRQSQSLMLIPIPLD
jgi:hexosaminidase